MRILNMLALILMFAIVAPGIADAAAQQYSVADFPYRHSDFDYKVAWKTTPSDGGVSISGLLKNIRYPFIDQVDVTIFLLGPNHKVRARKTALPVPQQSRQNDVVSFAVKLNNVSFNQGDTLAFAIHYNGSEGGGGGGGVDWQSTFAVDAITGAPIKKGNGTSEEW